MSGAHLEIPPRRRLGVGAAIVLVLVVAALAVVVGIVRSMSTPSVSGEAVAPVGSEPQTPAVYVHVHGAVVAPGLYVLDEGARVVDVIAAAGGLAEGADVAAVNLARRVSDGEHLRVPLVGEQPPESASSGLSSDGRVNLNTADTATLETLPRVGPAIAHRIIEWRESNGGFTSVDDLLAIPGIGEKMLAAMRDAVTV